MIKIIMVENPMPGERAIIFVEVEDYTVPTKSTKKRLIIPRGHGRLDKEIPYPP
jgi:hypothetical protein